MAKIYAGIGSRRTPGDVLARMRCIAAILEPQGYLLRSGGAPGADRAFQTGVKDPRHHSIYLPGKSLLGMNVGPGIYDATTLPGWPEALQTVSRFHPNPGALSSFAKKLMARNAMQVLGPRLDREADFVVAWAPGGYEDELPPPGFQEGGTGQALRIARGYGIPIINLASEQTLELVDSKLRKLLRGHAK